LAFDHKTDHLRKVCRSFKWYGFWRYDARHKEYW